MQIERAQQMSFERLDAAQYVRNVTVVEEQSQHTQQHSTVLAGEIKQAPVPVYLHQALRQIRAFDRAGPENHAELRLDDGAHNGVKVVRMVLVVTREKRYD